MGDDLRLAVCPPESDDIFSVLAVVSALRTQCIHVIAPIHGNTFPVSDSYAFVDRYPLFANNMYSFQPCLASFVLHFIFIQISLFAFMFEISVTSIAKPKDYPFKFYFYLDILATISLIPDIGWIWDPLVSGDSFGVLFGGDSSEGGNFNASTLSLTSSLSYFNSL